jgi:hypothetical protein
MKTQISLFFMLSLFQIGISQSKEELEIIQFHQEVYNSLLDDHPTPNYLAPIVMSDSLLALCEGTQFESLAAQSLSWYYSYVGAYKQALQLFAKTLSPSGLSTTNLIPIQKYKKQDAAEYITAQATDYDYLLLNEAHHKPVHRVFAATMLQQLKAQGYNTLALEAIGIDDTLVNQTKLLDESLGGLTMEPNLASLIREALDLGFYILPYDYSDAFDFVQRDSFAARRILDYSQKNDGKVIVFCGFEHVDESQQSLAYWLKHFTQKDVLTINQTRFTEEAAAKYEVPYYQMAMEAHEDTQAFILRKGKQLFQPELGSDIFIFHPRTDYSSGRESWLFNYLRPKPRYTVELPKQYSKKSEAISLLQVFYTTEYDKGIPVDQILIDPDNDEKLTLVIPEGEFIVRITDPNRTLITLFELQFEQGQELQIKPL